MLVIKQKAAHTAALILFAITLLVPTLTQLPKSNVVDEGMPKHAIACLGPGGGSQGGSGAC